MPKWLRLLCSLAKLCRLHIRNSPIINVLYKGNIGILLFYFGLIHTQFGIKYLNPPDQHSNI